MCFCVFLLLLLLLLLLLFFVVFFGGGGWIDYHTLLSLQHETCSKLSCKVCSTCISFPDGWSVVSSANMAQATEMFVTCNGRSLIKILNRIGPRTDPRGTTNFTEPSEDYEPRRKTLCVLSSKIRFEKR